MPSPTGKHPMKSRPRDHAGILARYNNLLVSMLSAVKPNISREDYEELKSSCQLATIRAVDDYDEEHDKGATCMTLVATYIRRELRAYIKAIATNRGHIFNSSTISTATPISGNVTLQDLIEDRECDPLESVVLDMAINSIHDPRRRDIVERISHGETLRSIGRDYGVSRQAIYQIKQAGVEEMGDNVGRKRDDGDNRP